jgi:hypothetical protein
MRRWTLIAALFGAGLAVTVAGFRLGGEGMACQASGRLFCSTDAIAEELVYGGLALLGVAVLTAVVTVARRAG